MLLGVSWASWMYRLMFIKFGEFRPLFLQIVFLPHTLLLPSSTLGMLIMNMLVCLTVSPQVSEVNFFLPFFFSLSVSWNRYSQLTYLQLLSPLLFLSPTQIYCWILLMDFISVILLVSSRIATCFIMVSTSFISSIWEDIVFLLLIL